MPAESQNVHFDLFEAFRAPQHIFSAEETQQYEQIANQLAGTFHEWGEFGASNYLLHRYRFPSLVMCLEFVNRVPDIRNLTELTLDASRLGIAHALGVPVVSRVADALRDNGMRDVCLYGALSAKPIVSLSAITGTLAQSGIRIERVSEIRSIPSSSTTWLNADYRELLRPPHGSPTNSRCAVERTVFGSSHYAQDRSYLVGINAIRLSDVSNIVGLEGRFPNGYIVLGNERVLERCPAMPDPGERSREEHYYKARKKVEDLLAMEHRADYIAQELRDVQKLKINTRTYREHRHVIFVMNGEGSLKLVGGFSVAVAHDRVEISSKAVFAPLQIQEQSGERQLQYA